MLTRNQGRALPSARIFTTQQLLGGASLVIPAGTTVRLPGAPQGLDFAGYNALAVYCSISGFAAGDALLLRVNTLDPENSGGLAVPSGLGSRDLITVTANGDFASTLALPSLYAGPPFQFARPFSDVAGAGADWSKVPPGGLFADKINEVGSDISGATYIRFTGGLGATTNIMKFAVGLVDPGTDVGWVFRITTRTNITAPIVNARMQILIADNTLTNHVVRNMGAPSHVPPPAADFFVTAGFVQYTIPILVAEATAFQFVGAGGQPWQLAFAYSGAALTLAENWDIAQFEIQIPGGATPGLGNAILPFFLNFFEWINSGPTDVTVTKMVAELTNPK